MFLKAAELFRTAGKAAGEIREEEQCDDDLAIFRGEWKEVRENRCHTVDQRCLCVSVIVPRKRALRKRV